MIKKTVHHLEFLNKQNAFKPNLIYRYVRRERGYLVYYIFPISLIIRLWDKVRRKGN